MNEAVIAFPTSTYAYDIIQAVFQSYEAKEDGSLKASDSSFNLVGFSIVQEQILRMISNCTSCINLY